MLTQAAFAKRMDVDPAYVYRLKKAGRLVMSDDGLVDAEKSEALIAETAIRRGKSTVRFDGTARERKDAYDAENSRLDFEERCGELLQLGQWRAAALEAGATIRARIENASAVLAPVLAPETDEVKVRAILDEWQESVLADISAAFSAMASAERRKA